MAGFPAIFMNRLENKQPFLLDVLLHIQDLDQKYRNQEDIFALFVPLSNS